MRSFHPCRTVTSDVNATLNNPVIMPAAMVRMNFASVWPVYLQGPNKQNGQSQLLSQNGAERTHGQHFHSMPCGSMHLTQPHASTTTHPYSFFFPSFFALMRS